MPVSFFSKLVTHVLYLSPIDFYVWKAGLAMRLDKDHLVKLTYHQSRYQLYVSATECLEERNLSHDLFFFSPQTCGGPCEQDSRRAPQPRSAEECHRCDRIHLARLFFFCTGERTGLPSSCCCSIACPTNRYFGRWSAPIACARTTTRRLSLPSAPSSDASITALLCSRYVPMPAVMLLIEHDSLTSCSAAGYPFRWQN